MSEEQEKEKILEHIYNALDFYNQTMMEYHIEKGYGRVTVKEDIRLYEEAVRYCEENLK